MEGTMDEVTEQSGQPAPTVATRNDPREDQGRDSVDDAIGAFQGRLTVTVDTKSGKKLFRFMEQSDQLLPGIPDEITLNELVPKMQWRVFHILGLVSHRWRQAIQSHQVHDARVRSKLTDSFLVIDGNKQIVLYSARDKYYYELPEIPNPFLVKWKAKTWKFEARTWKWIALDGRLYVIGGAYRGQEEFRGSADVWVLDLAGQREWKQCASMEHGRLEFACGVLNGRIFVFGGISCGKAVFGSEVYDIKEDSWSAISPEISWRWKTDVAALGEELVLFNGRAFDPKDGPVPACNDEEYVRHVPYSPWFWEAYNPDTGDCHIVRPGGRQEGPSDAVISKGKFLVVDYNGVDFQIDAYDCDQNTWSQLHTVSFAEIPRINRQRDNYDIYAKIAVNEEMFVAVCSDEEPDLLLLSDGLGSDKDEISWTVENECLPCDYFHFQCVVEL